MLARTMKLPVYLLGMSAMFAAWNAHAQSTPQPLESPTTPQTNTPRDATPSAALPPPQQPAAASDTPPPAPAPTPAMNGMPPAPPPPPIDAAPPAKPLTNPWFTRPSMDIASGPPNNQWKLTLYGFAELDIDNDSTRSFADLIDSATLSRDGTQAGTYGRTQFSIRNSRIGIRGYTPTIGGIKGSAVLEGDFFGYEPAPPTTSEAGYFNNPTFRIRHAYIKAESDVVDVVAGQTWRVLGWQNYFFPTSVAFIGLANEVFGRTGQVRVSHTFKSEDVNVDVAIAALRPIQRDSSTPDGEAGLRLSLNHFKALSTPGSLGTAAFPAAIGVSGLMRRFKVDQFAATPNGTSTDNGWAVAANLLLPVIPAIDNTDRANKLTLVGEFTVGTGDADQFSGMTAGAGFPKLPGGAAFNADVDNGLVAYDPSLNGVLHTIDWRTFLVGLQYYLPPTGRVFVSANYTQGDSDNMSSLFPKSQAAFNKSQWFDANVFFDVTPAFRVGASYQYVKQTFCDDATAQNHRYEGTFLYVF